MNFEQTINTLRDWQEENESRCFACLIADTDTNGVQVKAAAGGPAPTIAEGLAAMANEFPQFDYVLQVALIIYARRQNDKAVEQFLTEEVKAAQEGESYREEQETHGI